LSERLFSGQSQAHLPQNWNRAIKVPVRPANPYAVPDCT
jgi:hypothetical protein